LRAQIAEAFRLGARRIVALFIKPDHQVSIFVSARV
jgi:hypothetical protein